MFRISAKQVIFLIPFVLFSGCLDDDQLVKLDCVPGEQLVCNEFGKNFKIIEEKKISPHDSGYDGFYLAKLKKKC